MTKPDEEDADSKTKCRMYVCDMAGTEPAADIYAAKYDRTKNSATGAYEYTLAGPDPDQRKTKSLQDQGG